MKLLASDYDKTLKNGSIILKLNLKYLKKFIQDGNIFLLNTGRPYQSIKKEIIKYNIPYHYLSCNDGNILFNHKDQVIYISNLEKIIEKELLDLTNIFNFQIIPIKYLSNVLEYEIIISKLNKLFLLNLDKIMIKYNMCYKIFKEKEIHIYIYSNLVSKSKPIDYIKKKENIMDTNIYTVGDNINDLEMLRDYNGYAMYHASKEIKEIAGNTCFSVSNLIRKLRR